VAVDRVKRLLARPAWRLFAGAVRCAPTAVPARPRKGPVVFACLHRDILPALLYVRPARPHLLVSRSPDGDYLVCALRRDGFRFVRGASGEDGGSQAFRRLLHVLAAGENVGVAVDGPRGPFGRIRPGVLQLARLAQVAIVPLAVDAPRAWILHTWDRTVVPYPGSRVTVEVGPPLRLSPAADAAELERTEAALRQWFLDGPTGGKSGGDP
jgi:hypothetical protein